jgi:hypothetical protein
MSESESECDSITSITEELDTLLTQLQYIEEAHTSAIKTLENLIRPPSSIKIVVDGNMVDFSETLEGLHLSALNEIKETRKTRFGTTLLSLLQAQS